jgi:hypothetical protein
MLRRIVLDVLKPHIPTIMDLANEISKLKFVEGVSVRTYNRETKVESVRVTIEGKKLNFKNINKILEKMGASVQSIDIVNAGKNIIKEPFHSS